MKAHHQLFDIILPGMRSVLAGKIANDGRKIIDFMEGRNQPAAAETPWSSAPRIALVIGHNIVRQGAVMKGKFRCSEFLFNLGVAQLIAQRVPATWCVETFIREVGQTFAGEIARCYNRVNAWQPNLILELHFNASNGKADYSLVMVGNAELQREALAFAEHIAEVLGTSAAQAKVVGAGERGHATVTNGKAKTFLVEPFFGDHEPTVERFGNTAHDQVANAYVQALKNHFSSREYQTQLNLLEKQ